MFRWSHLHSFVTGSLLTLAFLSDHLLWSMTLLTFSAYWFGKNSARFHRFITSRPTTLRLLRGGKGEEDAT